MVSKKTNKTTVQLTRDTYDRLLNLKKRDMSFNDVVDGLMTTWDMLLKKVK